MPVRWYTACCFSITLAVFSLFPAPTLAEDWPQYGGPTRNWTSAENGWNKDWNEKTPETLWTNEIGIGFSSIAVADGKVYSAGFKDDQDTVYCFDAVSGAEVWKYSYPAPLLDKYYEGGPGGTPSVVDGKLYFISKEGTLYCLNSADGKEVWKKDLKKEFDVKQPEWAFAGSTWVVGDALYVDMGVQAKLDKNTGKVIWRTKDYKPAYSSPVEFKLADQTLVASIPEYGLVVLTADKGKEVAKARWETEYGVNAAAPVIFGDKFFVSSGYDRGCAAFQLAGKELTNLWENKEMRNHFNTSVFLDGFIYGVDEKTLKCLDAATGEVKWTEEGLGKGSLILADGNLIVLSEKGELVLAPASPDGFSDNGRYQALGGKCWTAPVLANGLIFARNAAGDFVGVDVRGGE